MPAKVASASSAISRYSVRPLSASSRNSAAAAVGFPAGVGASCSGLRRAVSAPSGISPGPRSGADVVKETASRRIVETFDHGVGELHRCLVILHLAARHPRVDAGMHGKRIIVQCTRRGLRRSRLHRDTQSHGSSLALRPMPRQAAGRACATQNAAPRPSAAPAPSPDTRSPPSHSSLCRESVDKRRGPLLRAASSFVRVASRRARSCFFRSHPLRGHLRQAFASHAAHSSPGCGACRQAHRCPSTSPQTPTPRRSRTALASSSVQVK